MLATLDAFRLESLNDVVLQITGVRVRDTVPDSILERADEIELVDVPPGEIAARGGTGAAAGPADDAVRRSRRTPRPAGAGPAAGCPEGGCRHPRLAARSRHRDDVAGLGVRPRVRRAEPFIRGSGAGGRAHRGGTALALGSRLRRGSGRPADARGGPGAAAGSPAARRVPGRRGGPVVRPQGGRSAAAPRAGAQRDPDRRRQADPLAPARPAERLDRERAGSRQPRHRGPLHRRRRRTGRPRADVTGSPHRWNGRGSWSPSCWWLP